MKLLIIVSVLLVSVSALLADDVYLKNGYVVRNVAVKDTVEKYARLVAGDGTSRRFLVEQISRIIPFPVDPNKGPLVEKFDEILADMHIEGLRQEEIQSRQHRDSLAAILKNAPVGYKTEHPKAHFAILGAVCAALCWDTFSDVSRINDLEDKLGNLDDDSKAIRSRKTVLGVVYAIASVGSFAISLEKVVVKVSPDNLTFSFNF
ncbi:hypothetical protein [Zoogloea sp.]|uniref:hypothetical protein n=1 Tax=Zoogloea sp. TaxID=49181 RepID=UPI001416E746|nr:MAG: hypothetical protein F9K15_12905 [Zoogloea sp.]